MSSAARGLTFLANQRRFNKQRISKRRSRNLAEAKAKADQVAADARIAPRDKGLFAVRLTGAELKHPNAFGLKRHVERAERTRRIDPEQERDSKGRLILKRARRLAKEKQSYDRERAANEGTYRTMLSTPKPPPQLPPPPWRQTSPGLSSTSPILKRGRPMSLQMGQGGWNEQGFFGLGSGVLSGLSKWALKKLGGGGQGPGPRMQELDPNKPYRGTGPGLDWADLRPGGATRTTGPSVAGYRLNKAGYFLKSGEYVPPGTRWVKRRRRNSLNPKALSRAIARISGAKKASTNINRVTIRAKKC